MTFPHNVIFLFNNFQFVCFFVCLFHYYLGFQYCLLFLFPRKRVDLCKACIHLFYNDGPMLLRNIGNSLYIYEVARAICL